MSLLLVAFTTLRWHGGSILNPNQQGGMVVVNLAIVVIVVVVIIVIVVIVVVVVLVDVADDVIRPKKVLGTFFLLPLLSFCSMSSLVRHRFQDVALTKTEHFRSRNSDCCLAWRLGDTSSTNSYDRTDGTPEMKDFVSTKCHHLTQDAERTVNILFGFFFVCLLKKISKKNGSIQ